MCAGPKNPAEPVPPCGSHWIFLDFFAPLFCNNCEALIEAKNNCKYLDNDKKWKRENWIE
jgi:hypothetical protein